MGANTVETALPDTLRKLTDHLAASYADLLVRPTRSPSPLREETGGTRGHSVTTALRRLRSCRPVLLSTCRSGAPTDAPEARLPVLARSHSPTAPPDPTPAAATAGAQRPATRS